MLLQDEARGELSFHKSSPVLIQPIKIEPCVGILASGFQQGNVKRQEFSHREIKVPCFFGHIKSHREHQLYQRRPDECTSVRLGPCFRTFHLI